MDNPFVAIALSANWGWIRGVLIVFPANYACLLLVAALAASREAAMRGAPDEFAHNAQKRFVPLAAFSLFQKKESPAMPGSPQSIATPSRGSSISSSVCLPSASPPSSDSVQQPPSVSAGTGGAGRRARGNVAAQKDHVSPVPRQIPRAEMRRLHRDVSWSPPPVERVMPAHRRRPRRILRQAPCPRRLTAPNRDAHHQTGY